jgi:adenylylsulfate kinase-like enzyme
MRSKIIWFTGLSGSGKTTLSNHISTILKKKFKILKVDGDTFRKKKKINSFTKKAIIQNNISIINYLNKKKHKYDYLLVSVISPLKKTRILAHKKFGSNYFEVHTNCNLRELIKRDTKKLYLKAKLKQIDNLIGYNSNIKYEKSKYKKITVNTAKETINESGKKILKKIN